MNDQKIFVFIIAKLNTYILFITVHFTTNLSLTMMFAARHFLELTSKISIHDPITDLLPGRIHRLARYSLPKLDHNRLSFQS